MKCAKCGKEFENGELVTKITFESGALDIEDQDLNVSEIDNEQFVCDSCACGLQVV